ncbi:MAG TPA: CocE/NonD family hydrolase [Vicinamibacteria bacterium]|nr:CocE/NonD family hydrolase [Vicinamibacteria bacterium]
MRAGRLAGLAVALPALAEPVIERNVAVPMRDGVVLRATVLRPADGGRFPTLVYRTPYGKDNAERAYSLHHRAVERGYAVMLQDVRGRYASDGEFEPYRHDGKDGFDTIAWAAAQPWSDGEVGTFGLSYPGAVQWLAALESPPALKAMAPAMTYSTTRNFFHSGGVFDLSWISWIWHNIAPDVRRRKGLPGPRTAAEADEAWETLGNAMRTRLPLRDLPELRDVAPYYFDWMAHPPGDPWWDWAEVRGRYGRTSAAVLNLSGWHDEAYGPEGALTNFLGLVESRRDAADARTELVIGPWIHGIATIGSTRAGEREFGAAAMLDYDALVLDFMDRHLRSAPTLAPPRVRVFVMGEDRWRTGDAWPLPGVVERTLWLSAGPRPGAGALAWLGADVRPGSRSFAADPQAPVVDSYAPAPGAHDYRALAERSDVAVFETGPLTEAVTVIGRIRAEIFVSVDAPDADLWLKLHDVAPDGTAYNLMSPGLDLMRASYRDGGPERKPLEAGKPVLLRFEDLMTGNRFAAGHRLRLVLTPSFLPHFSRNLHTGESETVSSRSRSARVTIHFDAKHPSRLVLPTAP